MSQPYDVAAIEAKWRHRWQADGIGLVDVANVGVGDVFVNLVEFPYPSAEGLHVGHVFRYAGVDAYGRYQRMRGRQVFQPIGFDAFGIHTENYALAVGEHPATLTARTTARFTAQLSRTGMAWDWTRAVDTSDPGYYRWTQWLLARLFEAGLMYRDTAPVVWCPSCLTVLAREQTEQAGTVCERCGTKVVERMMRQWFLRITAYAQRLLDGLDHLDWPERAKRLQRQWIGRSKGREIDFGDLRVFTTRPDTLPAVTFLAVPAGHRAAGTTVPHPLSGQRLRVCAADYVVESYGTGAVMGVPAHDERDRRFAAELGLPVYDAPLLTGEQADQVGRPAVRYRLRDWLISRQRYWGPPIPIVHCGGCGPVAVADDELPVRLPHIDDFRPAGTGASPLALTGDWVTTACPRCHSPAERETDVSDTFVDSAWYFLRYPSTDVDDRPWDPERTSRVLPVDFYAGGPEHVQRHHLYARFVTMALHDLGLVPFDEPFPRIRLGGVIVHAGAKMSKSRGNVVSPDGYLDSCGADVLRCALLFCAPWDQGGQFSDSSIAGIERFLARVWRVVTGPDAAPSDADSGAEARTIVAVSEAIERLAFNVGLARLMELLPTTHSARSKRVFVRLLAPFAPHLAEELWCQLGEPYSVHTQPWPETDTTALVLDEVEIIIQVDGRRRGTVLVPTGATSGEIASQARVAGLPVPEETTVVRLVHIQDRLLNMVTHRRPRSAPARDVT